jgi:putative nucleotidyltransferase with HDIG domain
MTHYLATGEAKVLNTHIEITAMHKDGHIIPVELSIVPLKQGDKLTFNAFIRDLSELSKHKEALEASELVIRESLIGTILAISKAVEARDPYTAGHQQRVSRLARSIAQKMGLDKELIEGIRMGAIIHDIGKIQLPAEILSKPGKLTEAEFELIKSHPESGFKILEDVKFPWPVADIAYQHHERIDGSGYPRGLKGDEICLEAKVIAVADVVEAMSSHRPYRPSLGMEMAIDEIKNHRGTKYDEACVDACVKLLAEEHFSF